MADNEYFCESCGEVHGFKCPKLSEKRREQVREAQQRYRDKKKAEKAQADSGQHNGQTAEYWYNKYKDEQESANLWFDKYRMAKKANTGKTGTDAGLDTFIKVAGGIRGLLNLIHPDKHNGSPRANKLTAYVIKNMK